MSMFDTLGEGQGFLKAGFLGFQGSGKTYTAALLAVAIRERFDLKGPIAFVDTENASEYVAPLIKELTGKPLIGKRTRNFQELLRLGDACVKEGVSALLVDSVTHFWRSLCDSYLAGINAARKAKGKYPKKALEFQDWGKVKSEWEHWTSFFLNSDLHVIICGRAGFEYDMSKNEDSGRNELVKTGIKMKTEAEFGFEPSLLVQMDLDQIPDANEEGKFVQVRKAIILKDRFAEIDGEELVFRKQKTKREELKEVDRLFGPHMARLTAGAHSTVNTHAGELDVDEDGDAAWKKELVRREILAEEIKGVLIEGGLDGRSDEVKKERMKVLQSAFGTRSWKAIAETMDSEKLRDGLRMVRESLGLVPSRVEQASPRPAEPEPEDDVSFGDTPTPSAPGSALSPELPELDVPEAVSPPSPPPPQPAKKGGEATAPAEEGGLPLEIQQKLADVIGTNPKAVAAALTWLRQPHGRTPAMLQPSEGLESLSLRHAEAIIANAATFKRSIGIPA